MKHAFRLLAAVAAPLAFAAGLVAASPSPGFVDFGKFSPVAGKQYVEVELDGALLKLAAVFADKQDAEIGKLVANLERVRVNVVGLSEDNRADAKDRMNAVRQDLTGQGWKRIVTVQEQAGDDIAVFLKQAADDAIQGIVVTVIDGGKEAIFVNVVGNVKLEQIAALAERLNLEPLRKLDLAAAN
ncbi:MAG TPA: DUF4252 domain-containing protein, partial [Candidatus Synoicihabitans sp.]|nr:DUF4252 domain-containing protein [Candidatus Synoicihabitans sp.]